MTPGGLDMSDIIRELEKDPPRRNLPPPTARSPFVAPALRLRWSLVAVMAIGILLAMHLCGCSAVVPKTVVADTVAFDGNEQNAGIVGVALSGSFIITANKRAHYNQLVAIYGNAKWPDHKPIFAVPLQPDTGITPRTDGTFEITREAMINLTLMHQWFKMGRMPRPE